MFHGMVGEAREIMEKLTFCTELEDKQGLESLPAILWEIIKDDNSKQRVRYWFGDDKRNV